MPSGRLFSVGTVNSVISPPIVIRPIFSPGSTAEPLSVNHRSAPGPAVMTDGRAPCVGTTNSEKAPLFVSRPILLPSTSANQTS